MNKHLQHQGFTLIEIMVVVVILGILATAIVPKIMNRPDDARVTRVGLDLKIIDSALKFYRLDNKEYPTTDQGLLALVEKPDDLPENAHWNADGYVESLPMDPWGNEYIYLSPGETSEFDLYSLGADGVEGGNDHDADISLRDLK